MQALTAPAFKSAFSFLAACALLAACGKSGNSTPSDPPAATYGTPAAAPVSPAPAPEPASAPTTAEAVAPPSTAIGTQTLAYPDDLQMVLLGHRLTGGAPPFEAWAAKAPSVTRANEFSRADALKTEVARLIEIQASIADIGILKLKTNNNFSEYDAARGGYYMPAFQSGSVYSFQAYDEKAALQFSNGDKAYFWSLDPASAQEVLKKAGSHSVDIDMTVAIERAERRSTGVQITGRVLDYRISSMSYGNAPLGEVTVK